ncbi:hypothetical protein TRFO_25078 [Tritrichomonas foetus]|uniref:Initiator binding domain-containing protein n=1 Tax=Tritrichomonas foetus TaxID=1144522 RepID=A0A1J4K5Z4_9EUKA|nr:hypothetical protein TRFO_25078 [Tritrichomonas foetus]|eukprot:OHT06831.1 hypothetical protein TRFO_25078 [Tritrichomonas foetus]
MKKEFLVTFFQLKKEERNERKFNQIISANFSPFSLTHRHELGFVPQSEWPPQNMSLNELKGLYFTRRNGAARQFDFKLYNALCITSKFPEAYNYVGAIWVTQNVMKIHSQIFANLLGIHSIQGGLFHKQGNFSRHGFIHVYKQSTMNLQKSPLCDDVDDYNVRLYTDRRNRFCRGCMFRFGFE